MGFSEIDKSKRRSIEKVEIFEVIRQALLEQRITHQPSNAVEVLQLAKGASGLLNPGGAGNSFGFVREKRFPPIGMAPQRIAETNRIFQRLTGTLRDVLQHRMGGVPEQRDPPARP